MKLVKGVQPMFDASPLRAVPARPAARRSSPPRIQWMVRFCVLAVLMAASMGLQAAVLMASNAAGNNHRGNMFDLVVNQNVAITQFDISPMGNAPYEVYYKPGTWEGFANTPSAWTLRQTWTKRLSRIPRCGRSRIRCRGSVGVTS